MKTVRKTLLTGVLVLLPLILTLKVAIWFVRNIESTTRQFLPTFLLPFDFPGLGFLLALGVIFIAGLLAQNFMGSWLVGGFDRVFMRIPLGGSLYASIKKFLETVFTPRGTKQFSGVVLVPFPRSGIYSIGFRTGVPDSKIATKLSSPVANIFVPCTPNPTSGFYLLVPEAELIALDIPVQEALKIVLSMGIVTS